MKKLSWQGIFFFGLLFYRCGEKERTVKFIEEGCIFLPITFHDTIQGNFIFDSGAYGLFLDSAFFEGSGGQYEGDVIAVTGSGEHTESLPYLNKPVAFKLSNSLYTSTFTIVSNLKAVNGKKADGLLGWSYFQNNIVEIDYRDSTFKLCAAINRSQQDSAVVIPFRINDHVMTIQSEIGINKQIKIFGDFIVDLGFDGYVFLTSAVTQKFRLDSLHRKKTWMNIRKSGFGDSSSAFFFRGDRLKTDSLTMQHPLIACSMNRTGALANDMVVGLLGNSFFKNFILTIDYPAKKLYLKPLKGYHVAKAFLHIGLSFIDRTDICEGFVVTIVYRFSEAESAGIKNGDIITEVNGLPVKRISLRLFREQFLKEAGTPLLLTLKRGAEIFKVHLVTKKD